MRIGQQVMTPKGKGQLLHPAKPGKPQGDWLVLFGKMAYAFPLNQIEEINKSLDGND